MICNNCGAKIDNEVQLCPKCDQITKESGRLEISKQQNSFGLVDAENGEFVVDPIFDRITFNNQYNSIFDAIAKGQLYRIRDMYDRRTASFYNNKDELMYMMKNGKVVDSPLEIVNGFGIMAMCGLHGIVDKDFRLICPLIFERAMFLGDDKVHFVSLPGKTKMFSVDERKDIYFMTSIDYFSEEIFTSWGIDSLSPFTEYWYYDHNFELMIVPFMNGCNINQGTRRYFLNGKYGLLSESGVQVTPNSYDEIIPFEQNIYKYRIDDVFGYMDSNGYKIKMNASKFYYPEYQRICNHCGNVWRISVVKETELKPSFLKSFFGNMTESGRIDYRVNQILDERELKKLQSCPSCGSRSFTEDII